MSKGRPLFALELTGEERRLHRHDKAVIYRADAADCSCCSMKARCTQTAARILTRLLDEDALNRMHQRATLQAMRLRRSTVELPFAVLKYRIFGHPRLLLRGKGGAQTEIGLATMTCTSNPWSMFSAPASSPSNSSKPDRTSPKKQERSPKEAFSLIQDSPRVS